MSDWSEGYVTHVKYITGYHRNLNPHLLSFSVLDRGLAPPRTDGFNYCELGAGRGKTLNLLAAANPDAEFWGTDFLPDHIAEAQHFADRAGLNNIHWFDDSFEAFLARDLPKFDYIVLHGVLSWVSERNRGLIADFIGKNLKIGGIAYVSYNAMPGWATIEPLRELILTYLGGRDRDDPRNLRDALDFAEKFASFKPPGLPATPMLKATIKEFGTADLGYIFHEYLNGEHRAFYFHEVAELMHRAKLSFVARADPKTRMAEFGYTDKLKQLLDIRTTQDRRTGLADFVAAPTFRSDIFMRGARRLTGAQRRAMFDQAEFVLLAPTEQILEFFEKHQWASKLPVEQLTTLAKNLGKQGIASAGQLLENSDGSERAVRELALFILLGESFIAIAPGTREKNRCESANAALMHDAVEWRDSGVLASPICRSGVPASWIDIMFLASMRENADPAQYVFERKLDTHNFSMTDLQRRFRAFESDHREKFDRAEVR